MSQKKPKTKQSTRVRVPKGTKTVTIEVGEKYAHLLYNLECENFIQKQPGRFILIDGTACKTGTMYFCSTYLEALVVKSVRDGVAIYFDETPAGVNGANGSFAVVSKDEYSFEKLLKRARS